MPMTPVQNPECAVSYYRLNTVDSLVHRKLYRPSVPFVTLIQGWIPLFGTQIRRFIMPPPNISTGLIDIGKIFDREGAGKLLFDPQWSTWLIHLLSNCEERHQYLALDEECLYCQISQRDTLRKRLLARRSQASNPPGGGGVQIE
jgi:hypothetical protein